MHYSIEAHCRTIQEEYEVDSCQLVGEPITRGDGGIVAAYKSDVSEEIFIICDSPEGEHSARYSDAEIVLLGEGELKTGLMRILGKLAAADLSSEDGWFNATDL